MRTVLVAGASGYLGRRVVAELARRGVATRALVRPGRRVAGATETVEGEVTRPGTLRGVCDGVDTVFSALGITRQRDTGVSYADVDRDGNTALLEEAERAGVRRFGVIAVVDPGRFRGNAMVDAKEAFVARLQVSPLSGLVVRSNGFFSDLREFLDMARRGAVWLVGDGTSRINPIDGADVATAAADALDGEAPEISIGGPDVLTWNAIARQALAARDRSPHIRHVPARLARAVLPAVRLVSPKSATTADFILRVCATDLVAPATGVRTLAEYYATEAGREAAA